MSSIWPPKLVLPECSLEFGPLLPVSSLALCKVMPVPFVAHGRQEARVMLQECQLASSLYGNFWQVLARISRDSAGPVARKKQATKVRQACKCKRYQVAT